MFSNQVFLSFFSDPAKLYFSVPVELYTVFSGPKTLVKNLDKNLAKNPGMPAMHQKPNCMAELVL